ncbi:MAG: electron transfer flavoprotein subunit beta/FixA family protein [Candidatus Brocadiales bacterium]|nr:electron transfer flavoprotein subunit beta/FixA family protein [Candidatus Bathyanammoxibius amoris]
MNIIACARQVPALESTIKPQSSPPFIDSSGLTYMTNPFDEFAVEEGIRIKERLGGGELTVVAVGPEDADQMLLNALAMGADRAVHVNVKEEITHRLDSFTVASLLRDAISEKGKGFDIILCGKEAVDDRQGAVGIELAELLGLPHVAAVTGLDIDLETKRATARRQIEAAWEIVECQLPAVITCHKGLNDPRYPPLPGIMKARAKPHEDITDPKMPAAKLLLTRLENLPRRQAGRKLEGNVPQVTGELLRLLHDEARVI